MKPNANDAFNTKDVQDVYLNYKYDFRKKIAVPKTNDNPVTTPPVFSFMMCVYNDTSILNAALNSLISQSFTAWELIALDNSDHNPEAFQMLQNAMDYDARIQCFKGDRSYGWAKGSSLCLERAKGIYTTFLASDDCLPKDILSKVYAAVSEEKPDVLWVGNSFVVCNAERNQFEACQSVIPTKASYPAEHRADSIVEIMSNCYYNAFFHYMRIDFLKENQINFFEPYYADCAGMTHALVTSEHMACLDEAAYYLTVSTSQTSGNYVWDSYDFMFLQQWRDVRTVLIKENVTNLKTTAYICERIGRNLYGQLDALCKGFCRDKFMNSLQKSPADIVLQLEEVFAQSDFAELTAWSTVSFEELLDYFADTYKKNQNFADAVSNSWLAPLFAFSCARENLELLCRFLLETENRCCVGFAYFSQLAAAVDDETFAGLSGDIQVIAAKYSAYIETQPIYPWELEG